MVIEYFITFSEDFANKKFASSTILDMQRVLLQHVLCLFNQIIFTFFNVFITWSGMLEMGSLWSHLTSITKN